MPKLFHSHQLGGEIDLILPWNSQRKEMRNGLAAKRKNKKSPSLEGEGSFFPHSN